MATSIRYITLAPVTLVPEEAQALDLTGISIPEQTVYVSIFVTTETGVFACEPGATEFTGGEYIPGGTRWSDGPFLLENLPEFYSSDASEFVVTIKPVVSER